MTTLFNNSDYTLTAETMTCSTQRNSTKMSKISHPLSHGSTMYSNSQEAYYNALAEILGMCGETAQIISQKRNADGTAEVVLEVWEYVEEDEYEDWVLYQYNIDQNGDYTETEL